MVFELGNVRVEEFVFDDESVGFVVIFELGNVGLEEFLFDDEFVGSVDVFELGTVGLEEFEGFVTVFVLGDIGFELLLILSSAIIYWLSFYIVSSIPFTSIPQSV